MPRFFAGDELGAIKAVEYAPGASEKEWNARSTVLAADSSTGKSKTVQKLAMHRTDADILVPMFPTFNQDSSHFVEAQLAAAHADGSIGVRRVQEDSQSVVLREWSETRLKEGQRFVGLSVSDR